MDDSRKRLMAQTLTQTMAMQSALYDYPSSGQEQIKHQGMRGKQWRKVKKHRQMSKQSKRKNRG